MGNRTYWNAEWRITGLLVSNTLEISGTPQRMVSLKEIDLTHSFTLMLVGDYNGMQTTQ